MPSIIGLLMMHLNGYNKRNFFLLAQTQCDFNSFPFLRAQFACGAMCLCFVNSMIQMTSLLQAEWEHHNTVATTTIEDEKKQQWPHQFGMLTM